MLASFATHARPGWRAAALLVTGMLAGVIGAPNRLAHATAGEFGPAATSRWTSCPGVSFLPHDGGIDYSTVFPGRIVNGSAELTCGLVLPDGASITAVKFHLYDTRGDAEAYSCRLRRTKLDPPNGTSQTLAGPLRSGVAFVGGYTVKQDTTISHAAVDNRYYAYVASCVLPGTGADIAVVGVTVRYTPA